MSSDYCSGGLCVLKKANGEACAAAKECGSAFCVDGYCCNSAYSAGGCDRCDLATSRGTCNVAPLSDPGTPSCAPFACGGASGACPTTCLVDAMCATGSFCSAGTCVPKLAKGTTCTAASACATGFCSDGRCCDNACTGPCDRCDKTGSEGTCAPAALGTPGAPSCGDLLCDGASNACPTSCSSDATCATGTYCSAGSCAPAQAVGAVCSTDRQCQSSFCVDGVCCSNACKGQCARCDAPGSRGTCTAVAGAPVGGRPSCGASGSACAGTCDGVNVLTCSFPSATTACGTAACTNGEATAASHCDGAGACASTPVACAPYVCGPTACLTSCTGPADCVTGSPCVDGKCTSLPDAGPLDGSIGDDEEQGPALTSSSCGCRTTGDGAGDARWLAGLALGAVLVARRRRGRA